MVFLPNSLHKHCRKHCLKTRRIRTSYQMQTDHKAVAVGAVPVGAGAAGAGVAAAAHDDGKEFPPGLCKVNTDLATWELEQRGVWFMTKCLSEHRVQICAKDTPAARAAVARLPLKYTSVAVADGGTATPVEHASASVVLRWYSPAQAWAHREQLMATMALQVQAQAEKERATAKTA